MDSVTGALPEPFHEEDMVPLFALILGRSPILQHFYDGALVDAESVTAAPPEPFYEEAVLKPYVFFDVAAGRESRGGGTSRTNKVPSLKSAISKCMVDSPKGLTRKRIVVAFRAHRDQHLSREQGAC